MNELAEDALIVLRQRLRAAGADLGDLYPTTARLRADLTGLLIQVARSGSPSPTSPLTARLLEEAGHNGRSVAWKGTKSAPRSGISSFSARTKPWLPASPTRLQRVRALR